MRRPNQIVRDPDSLDLKAIRSWYGNVQKRIGADARFAPGDVIASWSRMARPVVAEVTEPTKEQRRRHRDRYILTDEGRWMTRLPDGPTDPVYDGPQDRRMVAVMAVDRAGTYVRLDGRIVRDRERALSEPRVKHWARLMSGNLLPSGRGPRARKGAQPYTVARALLLWSLRSHLGLRSAARRVIIWDAELGTRFANEKHAELMWRFEDRDPITADERHRRVTLESTVITTSERIWKTIGLRPASSLGI